MGSQPDMNPVTVHIHINRNNLGFEVSSSMFMQLQLGKNINNN
jgi:hypothetical protein